MNRLSYLPSFEDDVLAIWLWVADHNQTAADQIVDRIYQRCLILEDHPYAGMARPDIAAECRHLVAGSVLILYRVVEDRVELIRALDSRRDPRDFVLSD